MKNFKFLEPLEKKIKERLRADTSAIIVMDGRAASGKTTAAAYLEGKYDANVIHMDDFFLPFPMRTVYRMGEPGGNVHYERIWEQVYLPLLREEAISYDIFDCCVGDFTRKKEMFHNKVTIVEGAYAMHPYFKDMFDRILKTEKSIVKTKIYDISIFFEIIEVEQHDRILSRNGVEKLKLFEERFIPMENKYFDTFSIKKQADFIVTTDTGYKPLGNIAAAGTGEALGLDNISFSRADFFS